ncbi:hypothetical protein GSI_05532 [Ganoderma sinense ZZ0214-1]|uniref:Uncharacterized protein n=1 Tax=Ganoderma sinense ZZ0214-1 TaxID=1077348 RepID=A0A2G8SF14_9APHY|nr:hypothetical protein GSI_05532 [Ganoderma sinense ZZ0214-1]
MSNDDNRVRTTGTSDSAQGIPEVVDIAGASGHGMDKAVAGRDVGGQEMKQVSESPQRSSQFISSLMVLPYLFPAYGLLQLATSLEVGSSLPEWYQLIRAAVVVTAKVEDLRHARERQRPTQEFNPLAYHGGREPWVMLWLRLQPTQRRRPVALQKYMEPKDCLHYPNNTSAADWREFWPRTRETIFTVMLELRACSPFNHQDQAIAETMDSRRWSSWVVDMLWVFRQLLRILPSEEDAIMTWIKRAQEPREPETSTAALRSPAGERSGRSTAGHESVIRGQIPPATSSTPNPDFTSQRKKRPLDNSESYPASIKRSRSEPH